MMVIPEVLTVIACLVALMIIFPLYVLDKRVEQRHYDLERLAEHYEKSLEMDVSAYTDMIFDMDEETFQRLVDEKRRDMPEGAETIRLRDGSVMHVVEDEG